MIYWSVALSAFLAATILPFYSEVALIGAMGSVDSLALLWLSATIGNTLGAVVNWLMGMYLHEHRDHKWFPFSEKQMQIGERWFGRYGVWSLLLSWAPVGGDALTFIAGMLHVRFWPFLILVAIGKGARYLLVMQGAASLSG